ncbi:GNAT family N-acetyltransferase [Rhizobium jaguaris]|uniref:GNAT family N-acetyltransferase n=1 Tax=Rhizobium jaguaris TaxID=1312183 RepID=A0A387FPK6_9HYPH|nr:GNAT family N-acetyltransferase [Rhizobium jaguaris]AYG57831.1 GNAT family N-acetyltransferase [Rhizobium jaguaris]
MSNTTDSEGLILRQDYFNDPSPWSALVDLLQDTFSIDISLQDQFCGPDPTSMPFGYFDETGRCVANFSAFSMPLIINGRVVRAAGYQSGAVRPEWRGRGLYRDLMQRAFARTKAEGFELDILLTDKPALYERYGFRAFQQHVFVGPPPETAGPLPPARRLSLQDPGDMRLLKTLLQDRAPVSGRFAVAGQMEMFHLNACFDPDIRLSLVADTTVVAWKFDGGTLRLLDVAGPAIPSLAAISSALDLRAERMEVCFPPDRLDWDGTPALYQGYTWLMMRGDAADNIDGPVMLSPMAEF